MNWWAYFQINISWHCSQQTNNNNKFSKKKEKKKTNKKQNHESWTKSASIEDNSLLIIVNDVQCMNVSKLRTFNHICSSKHKNAKQKDSEHSEHSEHNGQCVIQIYTHYNANPTETLIDYYDLSLYPFVRAYFLL